MRLTLDIVTDVSYRSWTRPTQVAQVHFVATFSLDVWSYKGTVSNDDERSKWALENKPFQQVVKIAKTVCDCVRLTPCLSIGKPIQCGQ
jgi:hypothetical protein